MPGIKSPRLKYSVLELERAAEVPIPYKLFSQTKTHGRFQTAARGRKEGRKTKKRSAPPTQSPPQPARTLGHVVRLKDLTLVGSAVAVHGEGGVLVVLAEVLLRKGDAGTERDLSADDTVTAKEAVSLQHVSSVVVVVEGRREKRTSG